MTIFGRVVRWLRGRPVWAGNRYDPGDSAVHEPSRFKILTNSCFGGGNRVASTLVNPTNILMNSAYQTM